MDSIVGVRETFRRNAPEIQFWGYEGGNILASISGSGGVVKFADTISSVAANDSLSVAGKILEMTGHYPDATVVIGLGTVVVVGPLARKAAERACGTDAVNTVDAVTAAGALSILGYALTHAITQDASLITAAASSFVVWILFPSSMRVQSFHAQGWRACFGRRRGAHGCFWHAFGYGAYGPY